MTIPALTITQRAARIRALLSSLADTRDMSADDYTDVCEELDALSIEQDAALAAATAVSGLPLPCEECTRGLQIDACGCREYDCPACDGTGMVQS